MKGDATTVVDLRSVSQDTRVLLRWVARDEGSMDDEARCLIHRCYPLVASRDGTGSMSDPGPGREAGA